jgi:glycosyltransferase involved in cell wall biosynthesis
MKLAVDARWMVGRYRGMGRYAHALLEPVRDRVVALLPASYPGSVYANVHEGFGLFPYWEQFVLPGLVERLGATELLCPYNTAPLRPPPSAGMTLILHDLIYLEPWSRLPPSVSAYQTAGRLYRRWVVPRVAARADRIVAVSNHTRDCIVERFGIPEARIRVIPNSIDEGWLVPEASNPASRQPWLLAVAGEAPSKNLGALLQAFGEFRRRGGARVADSLLRIVGIGASHQPHFGRLATRAGVAEHVRFEPFLDEEALRSLYRSARLFVMPSLYEGFGIPVLEAMASGTPVACSNTTALPEVVGDAGWLFDPRDTASMASTLLSAWTDPGALAEFSSRGHARVSRFTREAVAADIARFWEAG